MSNSKMAAWLGALIPDIGDAVRRFPVAVAIAVAFTLLRIFDVDKALGLNHAAAERLWLGLGAAFLWALAVGLFSESRSWGWAARLAPLAAGLVVIAALYIFSVQTALQPYLFLAGVAILPGVAAYAGREAANTNSAFWQFNHRLWFGAGLALIAALLFAGGLWLIFETLEFLFGLALPRRWLDSIWTIALGLVAPLHWLSMTPRDFGETVLEGEQADFTSRAVATIVKWVLVPLLLVYTAILYAYAVKIALEGVLPQGRLGPMVLIYATVGVATVLCVFPSRASSGPLVAFFWRWWYVLTSVPVVLLVLAAYRRIDEYGLTVERYLLVLACIWLIGLAALYAFRAEGRDLRFLPLSACLLLLLAALGPWGAVAWSVRSQTAELATLLQEQGRLRDGHVVADAAKLSKEASRRVSSIVRYLDRQGQLTALAPWFKSTETNPFAAGEEGTPLRTVLRQLGAPASLATLRKGQWFNYRASIKAVLPLGGYGRLIGPLDLNGRFQKSKEVDTDRPPLRLIREDGALVLEDASGSVARFALAAALAKAGLTEAGKAPETKQKEPLTVAASDGVQAMLIVETIGGWRNADEIEIDSGRFWVLLGG